MPENPKISVVIPVHNESGNVSLLAEHLQAVLADDGEIIFIDDGSRDGTWDELKNLHQPDRVRLIRFRRNFGKAAALMAGFQAARGDVVFTMDGDLQDDPDEIPRFLEKLAEGHDVVAGWKKKRHDPAAKVIPSRIFNWVVGKTTGVALHDVNCGFKAFRGQAARDVNIWGELHRFIPILLDQLGYRIGEIEVKHHPRMRGLSKYGFSRLFKGFFDLVTVLLITRYSDRPSHAFGFVAIALFLVAAAAGILVMLPPFDLYVYDRYYTIQWLPWLPWLPATAGLISLAAGWVAEIVVAQGRRGNGGPLYAVEEQLD